MTDPQSFVEFKNPEVELLLSCARTQLDSAQAARIGALLQGEIDWDRTIRLARLHAVLPLVYWHLNMAYRQYVPPSIMEQLRQDFEINENRNLFLTRELLRLIDLFKEHGISSILYKGPILAVLGYEHIGLRAFDDLDILAHKTDVLRVKELLLARGYKPTMQMNEAQETIYLASNYHYVFVDLIGLSKIEIHWAVWKKGLSATPSQAGLWEHVNSVDLLGQSVMTFSPEDTLILSCVHGSKHMWHVLGWICDVAQLIHGQRTIDWDQLFARARALGTQNMLFLGLHLASGLLQAPLPETVKQTIDGESAMKQLAAEIEESLVNEMRDEKDESSPFKVLTFDNYLDILRTKERLRDRARSVIWSAFSPNLDDYDVFSLPTSFIKLYYVLHPVRMAGRYLQWLLKRPR